MEARGAKTPDNHQNFAKALKVRDFKPWYFGDMTQRQLVAELADYLSKRLDALRPDEASAAPLLCELVKNQRLG